MKNLFTNKPCLPNDLTILYLSKRLKRLNRRTQKANASDQDYINRDRVAQQLAEAQNYLC